MKRTLLSFLLLISAAITGLMAENNPHHGDWAWSVIPDHADWLYKTGEKASVKVTLTHDGMPVQGGVIKYRILNDRLPLGEEGKVNVKDGCAAISIGTSKKPGFRNLSMVYSTEEGDWSDFHIKVGFDVEKIAPWTKEPADFNDFWDAQKKECSSRDLSYRIEKVEEQCIGETDCYKVRLETVGKHIMYGYLYMPKNAAKGSCPVLINPPGAGIKRIDAHWNDEFARRGIIAFEFEIHGMDLSFSHEQYAEIQSAMTSQKPYNYIRYDMEDRDAFYMKHVYQGLVKAIDLVTSLPEWDGKNVIAYGGSQGGALSLVAAGLDPRVTQCIAYYPALVDIAGYSVKGQMGGWPHFTYESGLLTPKAVETLAYFDVINFVRHISVPTFLCFGYCDNVCPPTTSYMVWNTLGCEKKLQAVPHAEHWQTPEATDKAFGWLKEHLK